VLESLVFPGVELVKEKDFEFLEIYADVWRRVQRIS